MATATDHATSLSGDENLSVRPSGLAPAQCAVAECAAIVSGKWTLLMVRDPATGPKYFNELQASLVGISPRTMCDRLKTLAAHGLVSRTRIKGLPPRSVYELTERGFALVPMIETMRQVGEVLMATPIDMSAAQDVVADAPCCGD